MAQTGLCSTLKGVGNTINRHSAIELVPNNSKILITGGLGFIGSHLLEALAPHAAEIYIIDNLSTACITAEHELLKFPHIHFYQMDLAQMSTEEKIILDDLLEKSSLVFHFAGPVGVRYIDDNAPTAIRSLMLQNSYLFERIEFYQKKLIFASSSEVYGECLDGVEEASLSIASPESLRGGYGCGKLMSEFLIKTYSFPHVILRFANVTGPRQKSEHGMVLPNFIKKALLNEDLIVHDQGLQTRSFCDIRDAVEMILHVSLNDEHENQTFNIAHSKNYISIKEMAKMVIDLSGSRSKIKFINFENVFSKRSHKITHRKVNDQKISQIYKARYLNEDLIKSMLILGLKDE